MATGHPSLATTSDDGSPFSLLKHCQNDDLFILRTRSIDEENSLQQDQDHGEHDETEAVVTATAKATASALNTSFEAAYLHDHSANSPYPSDDDLEGSELSGRKHMRPNALREAAEVHQPGTVRKQARTFSTKPATPRVRPPGAMKKSASTTPSSAAKRRRAQWQPDRSAVPGVPPTPFAALLSSPPSRSVKYLENSIFAKDFNGSIFTASPLPAQTPNLPTGPFGTANSLSKFYNTTATNTTAASSAVETTVESSDSVGTASPTTTRFRFTSFPASLPRVNNPRSRDCPESLRKRIPFAPEPPTSQQSDANQSRDDDGTQNTSISSLSAEGHQHMALAPGSLVPPTILDIHAPALGDEEDPDRPIHANLFADDEEFGYSDDDDDDDDDQYDNHKETQEIIAGRTRLNFNAVLSPNKEAFPSSLPAADDNVDLTSTYDQKRINSFQSSLSSTTQMSNSVVGNLTPSRPTIDRGSHSQTPREVQLHFPIEDECSPIPGFKEDPSRIEVGDPMPTTPNELSSSAASGPALLPRSSHAAEGIDSSVSLKDGESSTGSTSANGQSRRLRPMPDMSAFESNNAISSSRGERSSDDSVTLDSKGIPTSQRRVCPPTPVRTPAWANENGTHKYFSRQSSLITTKVLLSVPSQVVEGRSSLENSLLDDDSKTSAKGLLTASTMGDSKPARMSIENLSAPILNPLSILSNSSEPASNSFLPKLQAPPRLTRRVPSGQEVHAVVSFSKDFDILRNLGSGAFADVYKVRSVKDNKLYAVKRNRRQFRGKRDRDMAMTEVQAMQKLQSVCAPESAGSSTRFSPEKSSYSLYLLFFYQAWQEDGHFLCQTELCCRDTCRGLLDSLRFLWNTAKYHYPSLRRRFPTHDDNLVSESMVEEVRAPHVPNDTVWKICHDVAAGLSHIHLHGMVHHDIKPSNIFFVSHPRFGAMCKIGDFGMAGEIGTSAEGLEGDTRYLPPELLSSGKRHPRADIFSLGLTIYEIATDVQMEMPSEGAHWHYLRSSHGPTLPSSRGDTLQKLVLAMTDPEESNRPTADSILHIDRVHAAGQCCDIFLRDYIHDIEAFDQMEEDRLAMDSHEDQTPRNNSAYRPVMSLRSPGLSMLLTNPPNLFSPPAVRKHHEMH